MIPKTIHYIWLGGNELPQIAKDCIESWKQQCPDFEIKRWDESNLNLEFCNFVSEAYKMKKYAFASDVLRLLILYQEGGIYLDIDVQVIKPLDKFLNNKSFFGFESKEKINPGLIFGSEKNNQDLAAIIEIYKNKHFIVNGKFDETTICDIVTGYYEKKGLKRDNTLQKLDNITIYPTEYFCPIDFSTNKKHITEKTHTIHLFCGTWFSPFQRFKHKIRVFLNKCKQVLCCKKTKNKD